MSQPDNFNQIALDSAARIVRFLDDIDRAYDRRRESGDPLGESDNPDVKAYCWPGWDRERVIASIIMAETDRHLWQCEEAADHRAKLAAIEAAIRDYYFALDSRQHGGIAESRAFGAIQEALSMCWRQGDETKKRKGGGDE